MKKIVSYIAVVLLSGWFSFAYSACEDAIGGVAVASDTLQCVNEETTLTLSGYVGSITWVTRIKGETSWNSLGLYETQVIVTPEVTREYAALVYDGAEPCTDTSNIVTIWVSSFVQEPNTGFGGSECGNKVTPFATSSSQPYEYWSLYSGPGEIAFYPDSSVAASDSAIATTYGVYELAWNISDGICTKQSIVEFTLKEVPIADAGGDTNICGTIFQLNGNYSIIGSTGEWSRVSSGGVFNFLQSDNPNTVINANPGDYTIEWEETYDGCSNSDTIIVKVALQPVADAGLGGVECDKDFVLSATNPNSFFGEWSHLSGGSAGDISFDNSNLYNTVARTTEYGENFILQWKLTNSFCSDSATVEVDFFEQPIADAGLFSDVCGDTAILKANPSVGDGIWSNYLGASTALFDNNLADSTWVFNNNSYGEYSFIWKETNQDICTDSDTITFNFFEVPVANAGLADSACGVNNSLNAQPSIGDGLWRFVGGDGSLSITAADNPLSTVNVSDYGFYNLRWIETNEICSDSAEIKLAFYEHPIANAGLGGDTCGTSFGLNASLTNTEFEGFWEEISPVGSPEFSKEDSTYSIVTVSSEGNYRFRWTETNVICVDTDSVEVLFKPIPIVDPGEGGFSCNNSFSLQARLVGDQGIWSTSSSGLIFSPNASSPTASIQVSDTGAYDLVWTVDNGVCAIDSTIQINFYEQPAVSIKDDFENCGDSATLTATLSIGSGFWSKNSGNGIATFLYPDSTITKVEVSEFDNYKFEWKGVNGECSDSLELDVNFLEQPVAFAGESEDVCGNVAHLAGENSGFDGEWYILKGPGTVEYTPDNTFPHAKVDVSDFGDYYFIRKETNGICGDTAGVQIKFIDQPIANAGLDQELDNVFKTELAAEEISSDYTGQWSVISGDGFLTETANPNTGVNGLALGENYFQWVVSNGLCEGVDTMKVTVYDVFVPEVITPNNDGDNDYFVVRGVDEEMPAELTIFNRWGVEVYYSSDYQNNWYGLNKSGAELANDTYFYILNINNSRVIKGYVIIKR